MERKTEDMTLQAHFNRLGEAWGKVGLAVCYALYIPEIADWLARTIEKIGGKGRE